MPSRIQTTAPAGQSDLPRDAAATTRRVAVPRPRAEHDVIDLTSADVRERQLEFILKAELRSTSF